MSRWRIAGINFDHFHIGDNLRMAGEHPQVEIVAVCDEQPERTLTAAREFGLTDDRVFSDYRECLESTKPDVVLLCPAAADHGLWTARVAEYGVHVIVEKPFAATLAEADAMIDAMERGGGRLAINWPMAWYATNRTASRLIQEGVVGNVLEVHYYDGNRGPLWHTAGKDERNAAQVAKEKPSSWFYSRARGGGSMLDYLGYGTTLATWFNGGQVPVEVLAMVDDPVGLEVDEHAITLARYEHGLSKFETRWGTFTDPWTHQPQPKCGFVIVGDRGTISSYDFEDSVYVQSEASPQGRKVPVDKITPPHENPVQYLLDCLAHDRPIEGPMSTETSRIGQMVVDAAVQSAAEKKTVRL
jgi:glucose-fructose oxidoreductase